MQNTYIKFNLHSKIPRIPLEGQIDLTYRCNNHCRHCWLWIPSDTNVRNSELSFEEIKTVVDQARSMGCRKWGISGGEPMLRQDFTQIFEYITKNSNTYSINTNGTLITPKIARLMRRKGNKMIALYGATAGVHDHITRAPGSFEAAMRGMRYLKELGAGFTVQLIPMRDNYRQFPEMVKLAESLSRHYRIGAPWLYLCASGDRKINQEIKRQRLAPKEVVELDKPDVSYEERSENTDMTSPCSGGDRKYLFASCIANRRNFHVDPYGMATFCCFVKDTAFRYDLRNGSFSEFWDRFIPSLRTKIKASSEDLKQCGSCELKSSCRFCSVYGYLEHGRFDRKVGYLCKVALENEKFKRNWKRNHRRFFKIADITIQVESDLPIKKNTFHPKFKHFVAKGPSSDMVSLRHHFHLPNDQHKGFGEEYYRKAPWAIYKKGNSWIYTGISPYKRDKTLHRIAVFNEDHTRCRIYNDSERNFKRGSLQSLTLFPTDQILLARLLADRQGCYLHSCGVNFKGKGLLFAGHSEAGKSTMARMLKGRAEILCDDRIIIRQVPGNRKRPGFKIYGTWSHGDVPDVSGNSAPLKAILFLKKSKENRLLLINDPSEITKRLLSLTIKPFVTKDWWDKTLTLIERISRTVPCYELSFDKSGGVVKLLSGLIVE